MPTNLLLLPFAGGYWFIHVFLYTRNKTQRLDGYRLLVESALAGIVLAAVGWSIVRWANTFPSIRSLWDQLAPHNIPFLGTAFVSLLLGIVSPWVMNLILIKAHLLTPREAQTLAVRNHGNHLLQLLHKAAENEQPVSITLDNNKVYIGLVAAAPNLAPHDTYLAITPIFSGYRVKETLELKFTMDYLKVYDDQGLNPDEFRVVIPVASVRMASLFDDAAYPNFAVESEEA